jgi:PAP2 superfamily
MWQKLSNWRLIAAIVCVFLTDTVALGADEVIHWNSLLLNSVRAEMTPPPAAARKMAITHIAIYDAANSIAQCRAPYLYFAPMSDDLPLDAAIASAAHTTLSALFPQFQLIYDMELADTLSQIPDGPNKNAAVSLGQDAAMAIIAERSGDPDGTVPPGSAPPPGAGIWKPTPPAFVPFLLPGWAEMPPFAMRVTDEFRRHSPPKLKSGEYTKDFNRVKSMGSKVSKTRTADQTQIALFWADGPGTTTPPGHWNLIAQDVAVQEELSTSENARLFALLNITLADAAIVAWDMKFEYYFWRPITAIREANLDNNPRTHADSAWEPLINTPPFPGYVSGHSTFSGSAATLLRRFFDNDRIAFTTSSDAMPGVFRSYKSFSEAADEAGQSRIYGGIHFDCDDKVGQQAGRQLANYVFSHFLK